MSEDSLPSSAEAPAATGTVPTILSPTPTRELTNPAITTSTTTTNEEGSATIEPMKTDNNGFLSVGSSPPAPQALLSTNAALSPGLPPPAFQKPPSPWNTPPPASVSPDIDPIDSQRTPRARQPSSTTSSSRLIPPDHPTHNHQRPNSRPTSQTSFVSTASSTSVRRLSTLSSPLCTPKVRDFAYPRQHKYHAPSFWDRRVSASSRSSTSSDLDGLFPQRLGHTLYLPDDGWKRAVEDEPVEGDDVEGEYLEVDGDDEEIVERRAVCVFDFTAECEGEISIETGQVIWVEFRKGVSGWLVVRDEITENKGLVPEGYVRFLNEEEERQYLAQSPPTNTLLPKDDAYAGDTGEETPRPTTTSAAAKGWIPSTSEDHWSTEPSSSNPALEDP